MVNSVQWNYSPHRSIICPNEVKFPGWIFTNNSFSQHFFHEPGNQRQRNFNLIRWDYLNLRKDSGFLIINDTTLDNLYSHQIELLTHHGNRKHQEVVKGINVATLLWTVGISIIPLNFRIYDHGYDGKTRNDHFQAILIKVYERGFDLHCVLFVSWYSSIGNLKLVTGFYWHFFTRLKSNHLVIQEVSDYRAVSEVAVSDLCLTKDVWFTLVDMVR